MSLLVGCDFVGCDVMACVEAPRDKGQGWFQAPAGWTLLGAGHQFTMEGTRASVMLCPAHATMISDGQWEDRHPRP